MAITPSDAVTPSSALPLRPLRAGRLDAAAALLAHAFSDDPATAYLIPDPAQVIPIMKAFFEACLRNGLEHGQVFALDDPLRAVAIWHVIDNDHVEMPEPDVSGMLSMLDEPSQYRWLLVLGSMGEVHQRLMRQPHTYLPVVGVEPEQQGRGLGSAMLAPLLASSQAQGLPCYLETFNPLNLPLYERHGLRVAHEGVVPGTTVILWGMRYD